MENTAAQIRKSKTRRACIHCRRSFAELYQKSEYNLDFKFGIAYLRKKFQKKYQNDGSERPGSRDDNDSRQTHVGTGDNKMVVDQIEEIPGPSGVGEAKTNLLKLLVTLQILSALKKVKRNRQTKDLTQNTEN